MFKLIIIHKYTRKGCVVTVLQDCRNSEIQIFERAVKECMVALGCTRRSDLIIKFERIKNKDNPLAY